MANSTYVIPVKETLVSAWENVSGTKGTVWGAIGIFFLVAICLGVLAGIVKAITPNAEFIIKSIANVVGYFMQMGILYIGIKHAQKAPINYRMVFHAFDWGIAVKIVLLYIIQFIIYLPVILFMVVGTLLYGLSPTTGPLAMLSILSYIAAAALLVYLSVRISISMAFVLDKEVQPMDAVKSSFHATRGNFWHLLAIFILQFIVIAISAIPLGIGLIWTIPFGLICYGTVYNRLQTNSKA